MNIPLIFPRHAARFTLYLIFSCILFFPLLLPAQIDTSKVGWRDRANVWTEENRFEAPLWFFPSSGIPADKHVMPFRARLNGSTNALWGISLMHTQFSNGSQTNPTYTNQTMGFGYNMNREDLAEPSLGLHFESQYYQGGWLTEFHLNATGIDGTAHRWLYSLGDRQTGHNRLMSWESEFFVLNGPKQPGPWLALDADNDTLGTHVGGSMKLLGNSSIQHNKNNYPILYGKGTQSFMQLLMLNSNDALVLGSIGASGDSWRPKAIDMQARGARFVMDGLLQKYSIGSSPLSADSLLQVAGGARFSGGIRLRSSFGADSLSATTKGYVDTRLEAVHDLSAEAIADSIATLEARTLGAMRDSLDVNTRQYTRLSQLSDSLNTLPRQQGISAAQLSDSLNTLPRQQGLTGAALRDSLDVNTRQYTRLSQLSDSLNTLPRRQGISAAQLSDSLNTLPRQQGLTGAALRDSLDVNTRQYTRLSQLSDSLNTLPRRQGISAAQLSDSLNAIPRQQGLTGAALRDSLDANTRQYTRLSQLSDSLNTIPRQQGLTGASLRDSLDVNTRQYTRLSQLSDSLNTIPRQQGMTSAALRDSLDANTRQYTRLSQLSDSLNTLPRQQGISAAQLSDSLNTIPRQQGLTGAALRDSLDVNTRQYTRLSQLSDSLNTMPRQQGISSAQLSDSLDANTRQYTPRAELADSLDRIPRNAATLAALSDSLDANERLTIRPTQGLMSTSIVWTDAEVFADTISSNTTYTFPTTMDGKTIVVAITSTGNYSVTWPSAVRWPYMRAPVQTANKTDIYTFIRIGSSVYGTYVQNY